MKVASFGGGHLPYNGSTYSTASVILDSGTSVTIQDFLSEELWEKIIKAATEKARRELGIGMTEGLLAAPVLYDPDLEDEFPSS